MAKIINTMISPRHAAKWGKFEALRELISNAVDADPNYHISVTSEAVVITTSTFPSLANIAMMGSGDKDGSDTIGKYGEGLKLAALVLTRGRHQFMITSPQGTYTFSIRTAEGFGEPSLHIRWDKKRVSERCVFSFVAKGMVEIYQEKFLQKDYPYGALPLHKKGQMRIYQAGIYVADVPENSLSDYNFEHIQTSRDRDSPNSYETKLLVSAYTRERVVSEEGFAKTLLANPLCFEAMCLGDAYFLAPEVLRKLKEAFIELYGSKAVLASFDQKAKAAAIHAGFDPIQYPNPRMENQLREAGIRLASEFLIGDEDLMPVFNLPDSEAEIVQKLVSVLETIGSKFMSVRVVEEIGEGLCRAVGDELCVSLDGVRTPEKLWGQAVVASAKYESGADIFDPAFFASLEKMIAKCVGSVLVG